MIDRDIVEGPPLTNAPSSKNIVQMQNYVTSMCPQESLKNVSCALGEMRRTMLNFYESGNNGSKRNSQQIPLSFSDYQQTLDAQEKIILSKTLVAALELKDFNLAITVVKHLFTKFTNNTNASKKDMYSLLGRIYLQLGDLQEGEYSLREVGNSFQTTCSPNVEGLLDEGILAFAQGHFLKAYELFHDAFLINPSNSVVRNNSAVCLLYLGRVKDAICILTDAANEESETNLRKYLKQNLSALKELEGCRKTVH